MRETSSEPYAAAVIALSFLLKCYNAFKYKTDMNGVILMITFVLISFFAIIATMFCFAFLIEAIRPSLTFLSKIAVWSIAVLAVILFFALTIERIERSTPNTKPLTLSDDSVWVKLD